MRRPLIPTFLSVVVLLGLLLALPAAVGAAEDDGVDLATAERDLKLFEESLDDTDAVNDRIVANLDALLEDYLHLAMPARPSPRPVPDDATEARAEEIREANEDAQEEYEDGLRSWARDVEDFRDDARDALLDALTVTKIARRSGVNIRDDVNLAAARALGELTKATYPELQLLEDPEERREIRREVREDLSDDIIRQLERRVFRRDRKVSQPYLDQTFLSLAKLNDMDALEWMLEEFSHTKQQPEEVARLQAAHKAMVHFRDVPGRLRHDIVDEFVTTYGAVESQARQSSTDTAVQAAKQLWNRIQYDTIRVVQVFAGEPHAANGVVYGTMNELWDWYREHDNPRREPWTDPKE